jgi:hypothetical protein
MPVDLSWPLISKCSPAPASARQAANPFPIREEVYFLLRAPKRIVDLAFSVPPDLPLREGLFHFIWA